MSRMTKKEYVEHLEPLQLELNNVAHWLKHTGKRLVVLLEGRDTAGKGGVISAITEKLNPRQAHVVALGKPTERERTQWYFQRYIEHLPSAGEMVLFDRSWYNRAGVEHVMGYCNDEEYERFLKQCPVFERMLVDDGILLVKYWLTVDQKHQEKRFAERAADPFKRWKLSPVDLEARNRYKAYGEARDEMLKATHTRQCPWTLVDFNEQRRGRLTLIRHLLDVVPDYSVPDQPLTLDPLEVEVSEEKFRGPVKPIKSAY
jgi:polyphosphate kinase 2